jgi:hypothetical protein
MLGKSSLRAETGRDRGAAGGEATIAIPSWPFASLGRSAAFFSSEPLIAFAGADATLGSLLPFLIAAATPMIEKRDTVPIKIHLGADNSILLVVETS